MVNGKYLKRNTVVVMFGAMVLGCSFFLACGGSGESDPKSESARESVTPSSQKTELAGWKTFEFQGWSISFPGNWNGDADVGVWWPGEGNLDMGRPALSVHCGGIPLMPNTDFEDRVNAHINGEPQERQSVSVSGFSGFTCTWEFMGKKHLGLFLEEKLSGGMGLIHFVDCQAPGPDFDQNKRDFKKIIDSMKK